MQNDVKQVDRDAAATLEPNNRYERDQILRGKRNKGAIVQLLAAHRIAAEAAKDAILKQMAANAADMAKQHMAEKAALQARVAELEGVALIEVPISDAVTGGEYLSLMKHGWISGQWDNDDKTLSGYYWQSMEWWPHRLFQLPKIEEPTQ